MNSAEDFDRLVYVIERHYDPDESSQPEYVISPSNCKPIESI
jgi:hypothetical protein